MDFDIVCGPMKKSLRNVTLGENMSWGYGVLPHDRCLGYYSDEDLMVTVNIKKTQSIIESRLHSIETRLAYIESFLTSLTRK